MRKMIPAIKIIEQEDGFGFVELLIASAIMFMTVLAFAGLMGSSLEFMSSTQVKTIAYNMATKTIEDLKDIDFDAVASIPMQTVNSKDNKYQFAKVVSVQDIDSSKPPDGKIDYKKVDVTLSWTKPYPSSYTATTFLNPYGMVETKYSPPADVNPPLVDITGPQVQYNIVDGVQTIKATAKDIYGVSKIEIYIDNVLMSTSNIAPVTPGSAIATFNWDTNNYSDGIHHVYAKAFDEAGNMGTAQSVGYIVVNSPSNDTIVPTAPGFVNARRKKTLLGAPTNKIEINWNASEDNVGVAWYYVYRYDSVDASSSIGWVTTSLSFTDDVGSPTKSYKYWVYAIDGALNVSVPSNWTVPDNNQSPATPTNIVVLNETGHNIEFQWDASVDDSATAYYNIYGVPMPPYLSDPLMVSPDSPNVQVTIDYPGGAHDWRFYITAVDNVGNESHQSRYIYWHSH